MSIKPPKWAVNAANRFKLPFEPNQYCRIDYEALYKRLISLQLRAYRRGVKDGEKNDAQAGRNYFWMK